MKRTDKGELSVYVKEWAMLTKSMLPLPDKFHGLKDTEKRYRQVSAAVRPLLSPSVLLRALLCHTVVTFFYRMINYVYVCFTPAVRCDNMSYCTIFCIAA